MTYFTKVQKVKNPDGSLFMVKVRLSPEYDGKNAGMVHATTEEGAAIEAMQAAYEQPDEQGDDACDPADEPEKVAETENPPEKPAPKAAAKKATKKK